MFSGKTLLTDLCHFLMIMYAWRQTRLLSPAHKSISGSFFIMNRKTHWTEGDPGWIACRCAELISPLNHFFDLTNFGKFPHIIHKNALHLFNECSWGLMCLRARQLYRFHVFLVRTTRFSECSQISQAVEAHTVNFPVPRRLWCCGGSHEWQPPS